LERNGIAWLKARIWKLRRIRRGFEKGRCSLCLEERNVEQMLPNCLETEKWREKCLCNKLLNIN
jgi:hypothetical protein